MCLAQLAEGLVTGLIMSSSAPKPQTPTITPVTPPPTVNNPTAAEAAVSAMRQQQNLKGMASTMTTGGQGIMTPAPVMVPSLMGLPYTIQKSRVTGG